MQKNGNDGSRHRGSASAEEKHSIGNRLEGQKEKSNSWTVADSQEGAGQRFTESGGGILC